MTKQEAAAAQARCDATNAYALVDLSIIRSRSDMDFDNHSREDIRALLSDRAELIDALKPLMRCYGAKSVLLDRGMTTFVVELERAESLLGRMGELE